MDKNSVPGALPIRVARTLLIGATVLWGLSFPLVRGLELAQMNRAPDTGQAALACADLAVRFGLASLFLLLVYGPGLLRLTRRELSQGAGLALFAGLGIYLQTLGLGWTDASVSAFLTQLYTLIVPLIVAVRDRAFPTTRVIAACFMVLTGAALLSPNLLMHFSLGPGEIVTVISTFFFACQIVWIERPIYVENRAGIVTLIMFSLMTVMFVFGYFGVGGTPQVAAQLFNAPDIWEMMLVLVVLCTVLNFYIMNAWQRGVTATEAGLIYCIEPLVATLLSAFLPMWISRFAGVTYPNEILPWTLLAGGLLIVLATILVATEKKAN